MQKLSHKQRVTAAREFAERWKGRGLEKSDTQHFWIDLCTNVLNMDDVTTTVLFESRTSEAGWIDVVIPDARTFVEQKSLGVDLDRKELRQGIQVTPFEQAKRYADAQRLSKKPETIVVCNFDEFRIHDMDSDFPEDNYESFRLEELPEQLHLLNFLVDPQGQRARRERSVSLQAGELIGKLYKLLSAEYVDPESDTAQHSLNVLCVRLVFCLYAEDAGVFPKNALHKFLSDVPTRNMRVAIHRLFDQLDTPLDQRDPYDDGVLEELPYVNGGLFSSDVRIEIPNFTDEIRELLLNEILSSTDWSQISPTIFGGVFESTLNPETRHSGGMHYTSPENIHRVIDPLFLNDLTQELEAILGEPGVSATKRRNNLRRYQEKISQLTFLDPACGSGNFLTETYISLRRLENKVLSELVHHQTSLIFDEDESLVKVSIDQFYGIEINDFAVSVAQTALWIAKLQNDAETELLLSSNISNLPLTDTANIVHANALQLDWAEVLDPSDCDYVIGNPPFLGSKMQSTAQKADLVSAFEAIGAKRNLGIIDFVAAWYAKTTAYFGDHNIRAAFVSTNSVSQGEQVANIWHPIWQQGVRIDFAHDTFKWSNESSDQAAVFVVIIGFSKLGGPKTLFHYEDISGEPEVSHPEQINAYLRDAPDVFIWNRSKPLSDVPKIGIGNKPIDGGNYLFTSEEKEEFLKREPKAEKYFRRWLGSREFLQGVERWVLWLGDASQAELHSMPAAMERVRNVREFRLNSKSKPTQKIAVTPTRFHVENMPEGYSLLIPEVSSERRHYVPIGFISPEILCSNLVKLIPNATPYHFGIIHSRVHNAWMRTVAGRLKSDYRYSAGVVYNNFVWPETNQTQEDEIARLAEAVIEARKIYSDSTISQMYDPDNEWMYPELFQAHHALDTAVERAYGLEPGCDEKEIVEVLFQRYAEVIR